MAYSNTKRIWRQKQIDTSKT